VGLLKPLKFSAESAGPSLTVAKYAYVPFGNSGVKQNLPLFLSRTASSSTFLYVKSSTKNPSGYKPVEGLPSFNSNK